MKSISELSVAEYDAFTDKIVTICREPRDDWGITVKELAKRLRVSQRYLHAFVDGHNDLSLEVAMQAGSGIYTLAKADQIVTVDEHEYKESLTYRK